MKTTHRILLIILLVNLIGIYGCAGFWLSRGFAKGKELPQEQAEHYNAWSMNNHPVNGTEIYNDRKEWCGLTIWIGLPVPLLLPICHSYTQVTFADNKPVKVVEHSPAIFGFLCGPFVPFWNSFQQKTMWPCAVESQ